MKGERIFWLPFALFVVMTTCNRAVAQEEKLARPAVSSPVPAEEWSDETKLWLARSLVGEVGWNRPGEYAAVAWVYATRARMSPSFDFLKMVRTYSAAVRGHGKRRNPWLFELGFTADRPSSWPREGMRWTGRWDGAWLKTLEFVDEWYAGEHPNPCPTANHFGGYMDRWIAQKHRWVQVECTVKTRNYFYNSFKRRPLRKIFIPGQGWRTSNILSY